MGAGQCNLLVRNGKAFQIEAGEKSDVMTGLSLVRAGAIVPRSRLWAGIATSRGWAFVVPEDSFVGVRSR
jgi:hypothetical protein